MAGRVAQRRLGLGWPMAVVLGGGELHEMLRLLERVGEDIAHGPMLAADTDELVFFGREARVLSAWAAVMHAQAGVLTKSGRIRQGVGRFRNLPVIANNDLSN